MADLTVPEVVTATRCGPERVAVRWPQLLEALTLYPGAWGRMSQIGLAATIAIESKFVPVEENLNYRADRLADVFKSRFPSVEAARPYARQPEKLANYVYANKGGNGDEASGDGWRYRGRGDIQVTLRDNYAEIGAGIGVDLLAHPEVLLDPVTSARAAAWYWQHHGIPTMCETGRWTDSRRAVNRGLVGLADYLEIIRRFGVAVSG